MVGAGSLAFAAAAPNDVPQAVTVPNGNASPALRSAIRALAAAHEALICAQADNEEAEAMWTDWQRSHPQPKSRRATRKWIKKGSAYHQRVTTPSWQALMRAEQVFARAQCEVALVPITGAPICTAWQWRLPSLTASSSPAATGPRSGSWWRMKSCSEKRCCHEHGD
jgi:hypothetical protein